MKNRSPPWIAAILLWSTLGVLFALPGLSSGNGSRVPAACVVQERIVTQDGVVVGQAAFLTSRTRLRRKRKTGEHQWNEKERKTRK